MKVIEGGYSTGDGWTGRVLLIPGIDRTISGLPSGAGRFPESGAV